MFEFKDGKLELTFANWMSIIPIFFFGLGIWKFFELITVH